MVAAETQPFAAAAAAAGSAGTFDKASVQEQGLSSQEAARRLAEDGPNVLEAAATESFLSILITQMRNVIFLLTSVAAVISWTMGDEVKATVLMCIVAFVCTVNAIGEYSGQDPGAALRKQMDTQPVTAIRDGSPTSVQVQDLVFGDVVTLRIGDMVPADMLILQSLDLQTNEAVLTGEPTDQRKTSEATAGSKKNEAFLSNMLYSGTSVVGGEGKGQVVATGMRTQVGLIAKRLKSKEEALDQLNPLQISINFLGQAIGMICLAIICVATSLSYATGYQNPQSPCADDDDVCLLLSSLSRGLLMAVSIIPHGLPFVVMVMLRVGSREMAARNAVVTRRSSVDYLGATSIICTDKTGTLTQGKMTAQVVVGLCRSPSTSQATRSELEFYPLAGASPNGGLFAAEKLSGQARRRMDATFDVRCRRQAFAEPGLPDLGDPESPDKSSLGGRLARAHLACGFLNCYATKLKQDPGSGAWSTTGNMTEAAVKVAAAKGGLWDGDGLGADLSRLRHPRQADLEVPFSSSRKMMATVHELRSDKLLGDLRFSAAATHFAILKGAPDRLLPRLGAVLAEAGGGIDGAPEGLLVPGGSLGPAEREQLRAENAALASRALRSLLVAVCPVTAEMLAGLRQAEEADDRLELLLGCPDLCFLSMWGIYDPPRPTVPDSVKECHRAGIRVVMITGDQLPTAVAIGSAVNIVEEGRDPKLCAALCRDLQVEASPVSKTYARRLSSRSASGLETCKEEELKDEQERQKEELGPQYLPAAELAEMSGRVNVWARAQPSDKVVLVESLIGQGYITAMTGDGVNDAPALKRADAGVAMGISGTSVAKNASDLILMDDDFSTIVAAVREGRRIYSNTQKYVTFNLSIKAGECMCLMTAIALGTPMPIRGLQLLLNLVVTHILPPLSLAFEQPESYLMQVPPRETKGDIVVSRVMWLFRWLPFVTCMPLVVTSCLAAGVWSATGFLTGSSLIGSSRTTALMQGEVACEIAGHLAAEGHFIEDSSPFHCRCHAHLNGNPFGEAVEIEQWGRAVDSATIEGTLDRWTGSTKHLFDLDATPWKDGVQEMLSPCVDHKGVQRWCWKDGMATKTPLPLLPAAENCAGYGARLGQSMAYVSIHLGEILTLSSFRRDSFFAHHMFTNLVFTGFLVFNLTCLVVFLYVPSVAGVLQLAPLSPIRLLVAGTFALVLFALNEIVKVGYRGEMAKQNEALGQVALQRSSGTAARTFKEDA